jgi:hypothetical protein
MLKSLINGVVKILLKIFINQIPDEDPIKIIAQRQIENIVSISRIYTDDNTDDVAQLRALWTEHRKEIVIDGLTVVVQKDGLFIKDKHIEQQVDDMLEIVIETVKETWSQHN